MNDTHVSIFQSPQSPQLTAEKMQPAEAGKHKTLLAFIQRMAYADGFKVTA